MQFLKTAALCLIGMIDYKNCSIPFFFLLVLYSMLFGNILLLYTSAKPFLKLFSFVTVSEMQLLAMPCSR